MPDLQKRLVFAYPGDLDTPTGGYGYDRQIIGGLRKTGWTIDLLELGNGFPFPDDSVLEQAEHRLAGVPHSSQIVIDGLAFGVMDAAAARFADRHELVALVHHPLCMENGLEAKEAQDLRAREHTSLSYASSVIVTSPATAVQIQDLFDVPEEKIHVVVPGTDRGELPPRPPTETPRLLSVGTIVPRKGYDLLFDALAGLREQPWFLDIAGDTTRAPVCYQALLKQLDRLQLTDRVTFHGAVAADRLDALYGQADIFVLASRYEGYGMAYTEALAQGLPVVGSGGGAVRDTLPEDAARYCGVEDVTALKSALRDLMASPQTRHEFGVAARAAAETLPTWQDAATSFALALEGRL